MTPSRTRGVFALVLVASGLSAACATLGLGSDEGGARFHRLWEGGHYRQAVALFERDSTTLARDDRVLWRVALARLQPDEGEEDGLRDPAGAARALEQLLEREPASVRAAEARTLLEVVRTLASVRSQLERLKQIDLGEPPDGGGGGS